MSRPDFMGLGLVSSLSRLVSSRSRGLKVLVSLETILSRPQDLKEEKNEEKKGMK